MKTLGRMLGEEGGEEGEPALSVEKFKLRPPVSTRLRSAIMVNISQSWKRSTISAQVNWNKFSFSNFLNTVDLISTNWFDMSKVKRALEYELTATLRVMTW